MSVILEALHKARRDREEGSLSTSRAVDVARPAYSLVKSRSSMFKAVLLVVVLGASLALLALIAGVGWWLFSQGGRLGLFDRTASQPAVEAPATASAGAGAPVVMIPVDLPPPVALNAISSTGAGAAVIAPATVAASTQDGTAGADDSPAAQFRLGTILCGDDGCAASLNGRTVRAGDTFRDHRVMSVTSNEVVLCRANEKPIVLSLIQ